MTDLVDEFGPLVGSPPDTHPAVPVPSADWPAGVKSAIAAYRALFEPRVSRFGPAAPAAICSAVFAIVRAACVRPMPASYGKLSGIVEQLTTKLIGRFEVLEQLRPSDALDMTGVDNAIDCLEQRLASCGERKRIESPNDVLRKHIGANGVGVSNDQMLRMFGHLTVEEIEAARADERIRLPEAPGAAEKPAIESIDRHMKDSLDRLVSVSREYQADQIAIEADRQERIIHAANNKLRELARREEQLAGAH